MSLELPFLFVEQIVQLHHLFFAVLIFTLELVPLPQRTQLLSFDLDGKLVESLSDGGDGLIETDSLS